MSAVCRLPECMALVQPAGRRGWCSSHYQRWRRHGDPRGGWNFAPGVPLAYRLAARTDRSAGPDACWLWLGTRYQQGYGRMQWKGRTVRVTHLVYELDRGHPPPADRPQVLHTCDNPPCVNPKHLWAGTALDNMRDRDRKGRARPPRGEAHGMARLTALQVQEIRKRYATGDLTQRSLAEDYGLAQQHVSEIVRGKVWA